MRSLAAYERELAYWADDEREMDDEMLSMMRNRRKGKGPILPVVRSHPETGGDEEEKAAFATVAVDGKEDRKYGGPMSIAPVQKCPASDDLQSGGNGGSLSPLIFRPHIPLVGYKFDNPGTPPRARSSRRSNAQCKCGRMPPVEAQGTIEELKAHRVAHQSLRIVHFGDKGGDRFRAEHRRQIKVEYDRKRPPGIGEYDAPRLAMSNGGATPGEWRLKKMYAEVRGHINLSLALNDARRGIKGAENDFPGIGRKSFEDLRLHLHQQACAVYRKYGVPPPPPPPPQPKRHNPAGRRCQRCKDIDASYSVCIKSYPCGPCVQLGLHCSAQHCLVQRNPITPTPGTRGILALRHSERLAALE